MNPSHRTLAGKVPREEPGQHVLYCIPKKLQKFSYVTSQSYRETYPVVVMPTLYMRSVGWRMQGKTLQCDRIMVNICVRYTIYSKTKHLIK